MARRRKSEVKASEKSSHKYVPVRKSSRQIAKKQLEEKRINGDISQTSCSNSIEDPKSTNENHSQAFSKKNQNSQKKHSSRHKSGISSNSVIINNTENTVDSSEKVPLYKRDADESDSQDNADNAINESKKLSPEDVQQVVVGNPNLSSESSRTSTAMSADMEVWSEDVIEETIICEEMEVEEEEEVANNSYAQDGVMIEQVLLVNESNLKDKNFVEFTVIQNEDGIESMVMAPPNSENPPCDEYNVIHKSVNSVATSEPENSISVSRADESASWNSGCGNAADNNASADRPYISKKRIVLENRNGGRQKSGKAIFEKVKKEMSESMSDQICMYPVKSESSGSSNEETNYKRESKDFETESAYAVEAFREDSFSKIDNKLANMHINECSKEVQKLVHDLSSMESIDSPVETPLNVEKLSPVNIDDESSSSILDKMEQLHRPNNSVGSHVMDIFSKAVEPNNVMRSQQDILNSHSCDDKMQCADDASVKSKSLAQDRKSQQKSTEHLAAVDEYQDSEGYSSKVDAEDIKLCSSSENSNDTLVSLTNYKGREVDVKNAASNVVGDVDKKVEFRGRSGSTDTTGSESGSNSSGVRRSSRIRSIGLMKQRSRGRGLVTKPNADVSKVTSQQEKEKVVNNINPALAQEVKVDNSEVQCEKENNSSKVSSSLDALAPLNATCNVTGYDSDSSKPVKVKSRWRRSSELEMGGSNAGFSSITAPMSILGSSVTFPSNPARCTVISTGEPTSSESKHNVTSVNTKACVEAEQIRDASAVASNSLPTVTTVAQIPKAIGAKISLPMVLETEDREMEERLSQFEHLHENLYLTERYTNKETKRMVCDCFLTEEEIERGELGCGEDCLNRLLMIECGPRCVVGNRCTNRRFQNCEYAKCEVFRTEKKGFGLRAIVDILAGEFIMEYVGEVVDPKDFRRRAKEYSKEKNRHYYFMALKSDQIIDATMKGNISRFINHSCDPNAETQKWTVNGELRIGFFNKKFIAAGEEITFDYHFQRYGKEAQKCYCEAPNCRGWIGETPEEEKEKIEKKETREKDTKKKKEEKKPADYMEDEDLEEEIDKLCSAGLKNRAHTLTLSRLMVRSRELEHRTRLLRLIQSGEQPCRRLFLDYHGLRLIWSYVMDIATNESEEAQQFRIEVLKTLSTLPIPNKTMLMDSKINVVVERWAKRLYLSPNADSPEDDQVKSKICEDSNSNSDSNEKKSPESLSDIPDKRNNNIESCQLAVNEVKSEVNADQNLIPELASSLLAEWSNLKEVFRIPKKERIEQMKEHEREADRGNREELEKEEQRSTSYDRHRSDRYSRGEVDKRGDRRRGRESPEAEHGRTKDKRVEERSSLVPIPRMTKYERRQLFALKVAKEEEERQRRQQQESWQEHENRCLALGIDPHTSAMVDPQTGYPVFYNPTLGQWQHYSAQDGADVTQQCTPVYVGPQPSSSSSMIGQNVLPSAMTSDISSGMASSIPGVPPVAYSLSQTPVFNQTTSSYSLMSHPQPYTEGQLSLPNSLVSAHRGTPPGAIQPPLYNHVEKPVDQQFSNLTAAESVTSRPPQPEVPPIDLPPKWKSATDGRGRTYYYHVKERISQWLPPSPDHIGVQPDSSSTSESSEESSSSNDDEEDAEDDHEDQKNDDAEASCAPTDSPSSTSKPNVASKKSSSHAVAGSLLPFPESKKRRDGLVQERIISPRREEDRVDHKAYKEIKDKLRRQKERAKQKDHVEKLRKHRRSNKSKSHSRHALSKLQPTSAEVSPMSERKIKDTFRINMANVMVHFLNPYRKNDCKQGRITNTEDFKHLARKLTHFVLAKELKHCKSVDELQCNENVKHKAKDFVRKYMSKFGAVYQKGTDED